MESEHENDDDYFSDILVAYMYSLEREQLLCIIRELDDTEHYSLTINCADLYDYNMLLVETLLSQPYKVLSAMDTAVTTAQRQVLEEFTDSQQQYMVGILTCYTDLTRVECYKEWNDEE